MIHSASLPSVRRAARFGFQSVGFGALFVGAVVSAAIGSVAAASAAESAAGTPEFPQEPENWINSGPISVGSLKGKAAFLWFFEEGCPTCKAKWPGLLATAAKFEGQPVLFIGVNSGSSREEVAEYAQDVGCSWPIIVDSTRLYEKQVLDHEISLSNIMQARVIRADGGLEHGDWSNVEKTIQSALKGAKWKVDPVGVPDSLRPAWQSIEFGDYPAAASPVKKALLSKKPDIKSAAEKLKAVVQSDIDIELASAKKALAADQKWQAYQTYQALAQDFAGYDLPPDAAEAKKKLAADPAIKQEILAGQSLDKAKKIMASGKPNSHKKVVILLEKLVKDQTDTTAGKEAKTLLQQFERESGAASDAKN